MFYCGATAKESALSYAKQRAGYAPTEIRVIDEAGNVVETIPAENVRGLVGRQAVNEAEPNYGQKFGFCESA